MNKRKQSIAPIICLFLFSFLFIGAGVYYMFFYNMDAVKRQDTEMELADKYVNDLLQWIEEGSDIDWEEWQQQNRPTKEDLTNESTDELESVEESSVDEEVETTQEVGITQGNWSDDNWYSRDGVTYTPDYAKGYVQCVLEMPTAQIRRGVYTGSWSDISYNLSIWMVTAARPDYKLGETHFCIYGHNHPQQDLSFNRLKDVKVGDLFSLTSEDGYFEYKVTNVFAVTRGSATDDFVDNFDRPKDKCYIITCGRGEHRYLDLIVEGTVRRHLTLQEYAEELRKSMSK